MRRVAFGVLAAWLVACGSEVSVGSAAPVIDLSRCQNTDCSAVAARAELSAYPPPVTCEAGPSNPVDTAFEHWFQPPPWVCDPDSPEFDPTACAVDPGVEPIPDDCPILGACLLGVAALVGAPDGSVFVLVAGNGWEDGRALQNESALWLHHYAEDGTRLGEELIVADVFPPGEAIYYTQDLSIDAQGRAYVLLSTERVPLRASGPIPTELPPLLTSLFEFDARGKQVGAPIVFAPRPQPGAQRTTVVSARAGEGIVFAEQSFGGGSLAFYDPASRALRWVHDRRGKLAIAKLMADSLGEVTLATRFPDGAFSQRLEHYAADGTLSWERELTQLSEEHIPRDDPQLGVTLDGSVVTVQSGEPQTDDGQQADGSFLVENAIELYSIGAGGDPRFHTSMTVPVLIGADANYTGWGFGGGSVRPVITEEGAIVFSAIEYNVFGRAPVTVIGVVSGDGSRCARYDWSHYGGQGVGSLATAGNNVYFTIGGGFGRLELPAELLP